MHETSSLFSLVIVVIVVTIATLVNVYSHIAVWCYTKQIDGLSDIAQDILVYEFWLCLCYFLLFLFYALLYCCIRCPVSKNTHKHTLMLKMHISILLYCYTLSLSPGPPSFSVLRAKNQVTLNWEGGCIRYRDLFRGWVAQ